VLSQSKDESRGARLLAGINPGPHEANQVRERHAV